VKIKIGSSDFCPKNGVRAINKTRAGRVLSQYFHVDDADFLSEMVSSNGLVKPFVRRFNQ
jgi:hypothetical protein